MFKTRRLIIIVGATIMIVLTFCAMVYYRCMSIDQATKSAYQVLAESTLKQKSSLQSKLDEEYEILHIFAELISQSEVLTGSSTCDLLTSTLADTTRFFDIYLLSPDQQVLLDNGYAISFADENIQRSFTGMEAVGYIECQEGYGNGLFVLSVPFYVAGEIKGVLVGVQNAAVFQDILVAAVYRDSTYSYLVDAAGNIIVGSESSLDLFGGGKPLDGITNIVETFHLVGAASAAEIGDDLIVGNAGEFRYDLYDNERYVAYEQVGINDWLICNSVDSSVVEQNITAVSRTALVILAIVMGWAILAFALLLYMTERERRTMMREQKQLQLLEQSYRIASQHSNKYVFNYDIKNDTLHVYQGAEELGIEQTIPHARSFFAEKYVIGEESKVSFDEFLEAIAAGEPQGSVTMPIYTPDLGRHWFKAEFTTIYENDQKPVYAVISIEDVSQQRQKEIAYEKWKQELASLPKDKAKIIEWNLTQDRADDNEFVPSDFWHQCSNMPDKPTFNKMLYCYITENVHSDDQEEMLHFLSRENLIYRFAKGNKEYVQNYRELNEQGQIRWKRYMVQMISYPDSNDIKCYIQIRDIDDEKRKELSLLELSEKDPLTGVLNRVAFARKMDEILHDANNKGKHAFIIADIDYFKKINDNYGHFIGDQVLVNVAKTLKAMLREEDLVGRLGGDEFVLLIKNISNPDVVKRKAEELRHALDQGFGEGLSTSCSMGISLAPHDGDSFGELYSKADAALYSAKAAGRNRYTFYHPGMNIVKGRPFNF